jgi:hypothetical protein
MGWEEVFRQKIAEAKSSEINGYQKLAIGKSVATSIFFHSIGFVFFLPLFFYVLAG